MKFAIVLFALFAVAVAAPPEVDIQEYRSEVEPHAYRFSVKTSDGSQKEESGTLVNEGTDNEGISAKGSFSYVGDDGQTYSVKYIADENGFQPEGAHLPVAPVA
ncbi:larval cuticle protein 65Ag1 [Drosophila biarmipes]|uniref:larval cuticle protein 65Ag1 n=1 Tax=Drosophila biarmipes TaxID=125945 RepID=UPI0007E80F0B|nr:larval cuticle protein 65Ag1 [Drosophila biarmipes]